MSFTRDVMALLDWLPPEVQAMVCDVLEWIEEVVNQMKYDGVSMSGERFMLLVMIAAPVLVFWVWLAARQVFPALDPGALRGIAATLADTIRQGGDPAAALERFAGRLPLRWARRARAAAGFLTGPHPLALPWALHRAGIIPATVVGAGVAAERVGPAALAGWCGGLAGEDHSGENAGRIAMQQFWPVVALLVVGHFLLVVIWPKCQQIAHDMAVALPWQERIEQLARLAERWPLLLLLAAVALVLCGWAWLRWRWRARRRLLEADYLVRAAARGCSEAAMGGALGGAHRQAGERGDFAALCRLSGWTAHDPATLERALVRARVRALRRQAWLAAGAEFLLPLLLALPIGALAVLIFAWEIAFMEGLLG